MKFPSASILLIFFFLIGCSDSRTTSQSNGKPLETQAIAFLESEPKLETSYFDKALEYVNAPGLDETLKGQIRAKYDALLPEYFASEVTKIEGWAEEDDKRFSEKNLQSIYKKHIGFSCSANLSESNLRKIDLDKTIALLDLYNSILDEVTKKHAITSSFASSPHFTSFADEQGKADYHAKADKYAVYSESVKEYITKVSDLQDDVKIAVNNYTTQLQKELENKYSNKCKHGYLHEIEQRLFREGFKQSASYFDTSPDGSTQVKMEYDNIVNYKGYQFNVWISLQYAYSLGSHWFEVRVSEVY
jgi:hypothetical protein